MFSFAIYDKYEDKLFCARDRLGIKPFIYYCQNGKFIFGSEIKVLQTKPGINKEAITQYLHYLYVPHPNTIFQNIMKLPPAHTFQNGQCQISKYWDAEDYIGKNKNLAENEILTSLDGLLDESVKMRMIADVELGSFLSGGIDSSMILHYMNKHSVKKINTYTLGFEGAKKYDETNCI